MFDPDKGRKADVVHAERRAMASRTPDVWCVRLEESQVRYRKATEEYRKLLQEQAAGVPDNPNSTLAIASEAEFEALAEYIRVLRAFNELTVNGKIPAKCSAARSNGS